MQQPMRDDDDDDDNSLLEPPRFGHAATNRRRRRSRADHHDPLIPWQAMKRLRVDATTAANDSFSPSSSAYNDSDRRMPIPTDRVEAPPPQHQRRRQSPHDHQTPTVTNREVNRNNNNNNYYYYDAYHCYQRHQQQETGQDTDGWSSPESSVVRAPYEHGPHHSTTTTTVSSSSFVRRKVHDHPTHPTPSRLLDLGSDDDDDIMMEYQNVNHILGNLHFERQQRMAQQQRYVPLSQQHDSDSYMDDDNSVPLRNNDVGGVHESTTFRSFSNRTDASFLSTVPPTPLNTRMMSRQQQSQQYLNNREWSSQLQQHPSSVDLYQTPPTKPTKRKIVPLYTNSKLA